MALPFILSPVLCLSNKDLPCAVQTQVAVALMQQMGVREDLPINDQARGFAEELMTAWGVGNAACNDGVLLLLSKQPREARKPRTIVICYLGMFSSQQSLFVSLLSERWFCISLVP